MTKKIGVFWRPKEEKENSPVASGVVEFIVGFPQRVALFENKKKSKSNDPDYNLVISENKSFQETNAIQSKKRL